ncbi:MAG: ribonuclease HII [Deltaproteobacteria bacterium]|jgi:ribonuclease HII|nr:ribonuclease HII [Deltaproteobacteria bacterium]
MLPFSADRRAADGTEDHDALADQPDSAKADVRTPAFPAVQASEAADGFFLLRAQALLAGREEMSLAEFDRRLGLRPLAGLDEAGRGPLAGPLVAAAVVLPDSFDDPAVNDSKKLGPQERETAFELVTRQALAWAYAVKSPQEVDRLNPLKASMTAMAEALAALPLRPLLALVDGDQAPRLPCQTLTVVRGDGRSLSVAAASIVAKVVRDRLMLEEHRRWPDYGFDRHKGYGTAEHLRALARLGPSPIHRRSFRGVPAAAEAGEARLLPPAELLAAGRTAAVSRPPKRPSGRPRGQSRKSS